MVYRILEKRLHEAYTCGEIIDTLRNMQIARLGDKLVYTPVYTRTDLTDALHEAVGFRIDYQIITDGNMRKICRKIKANYHFKYDMNATSSRSRYIRTAASSEKGMIRFFIMTVPTITLKSNRKMGIKSTVRAKNTAQTQSFRWAYLWMETASLWPSLSFPEMRMSKHPSNLLKSR